MQCCRTGWVAALIALLVVGCGGGGGGGGSSSSTPPVAVPNVVGDTQAAATTAIAGAGLTVGTVTTQSSSATASGSVTSEDPVAGTDVQPGQAVSLVVSSGPPLVAVPNVVGETQAAATTAIDAAGLTVGTVTLASSSSVASGSVISESPPAAASVATGSAVSLTVSSGPAQVAVPNVVGDTQAAATTALAAAGLTVGTVALTASATVPGGSVISESPSATKVVSTGSAVNLTVSSSYLVSVTVSGLSSGTSVTVADNGGDHLTFTSNTTASFAIPLTLNAAYTVTVTTPPVLEACKVTGGTGQITGPTAVSVGCALAPPSTTYPAFAAPYPQVVSGQSPPPVIPYPRIVPVFFTDTPYQPETVTLLQSLATSQEWSVLAEYGVGAATVGAPVYLTTATPASMTSLDVQSFVAANAASWGTLDGSEIFILYFTPSTVLSDDPHPFHTIATTSASQQVPYAVIQYYGQVGPPIDYAYAQFHELAEASTDTVPPTAYGSLNHDVTAWGSIGGTELADMCSFSTQYYDYSIQGIAMWGVWSDAAVNAGHTPCTTAGSTNLPPGFGAYPVLPDSYVASAAPGDTNASVTIAPGASVTIPINVFSDAPLTTPITIAVSQLNTNGAKTNALTLSLDQTTALNGSVVHLTITAPPTPLSSTTTYAEFLITTTLPSSSAGYPQNVFPGIVTN